MLAGPAVFSAGGKGPGMPRSAPAGGSFSGTRAVLATFAELVSRDRLGPVADVGCGPGRITGYLHHLGLDAFGVDLSSGMPGVARQALPGLRFVEGSMIGLDLPDAVQIGDLGSVRHVDSSSS